MLLNSIAQDRIVSWNPCAEHADIQRSCRDAVCETASHIVVLVQLCFLLGRLEKFRPIFSPKQNPDFSIMRLFPIERRTAHDVKFQSGGNMSDILVFRGLKPTIINSLSAICTLGGICNRISALPHGGRINIWKSCDRYSFYLRGESSIVWRDTTKLNETSRCYAIPRFPRRYEGIPQRPESVAGMKSQTRRLILPGGTVGMQPLFTSTACSRAKTSQMSWRMHMNRLYLVSRGGKGSKETSTYT